MNVEGFNGKTPVINGRLVVNGLTELEYKIVEITNETFRLKLKEDKDPPKVGESLTIYHDFKPAGSVSMNGWEMLYFIIGRVDAGHIHNYVRYFRSLDELKSVLDGNKFEIDRQFALDRISAITQQIEKYKHDYGI